MHEELFPMEEYLLPDPTSHRGEGGAAAEEPPGEFSRSLQAPARPRCPAPTAAPALADTGGAPGPLWQVCPPSCPRAGALPAPRSPAAHPAVAPSPAPACVSRAAYGQIFHFSFITPACTVT